MRRNAFDGVQARAAFSCQQRFSRPVCAGPEDVPLVVSGINEATCRGARAIVIGEEDARLRANAHDVIVLPQSGELLNPLLAVIPLQLLAYRVSVALGYDPDFPRNLTKTLTVD